MYIYTHLIQMYIFREKGAVPDSGGVPIGRIEWVCPKDGEREREQMWKKVASAGQRRLAAVGFELEALACIFSLLIPPFFPIANYSPRTKDWAGSC